MAKPNFIRDTNQLCSASRGLSDQSATLISGSDAACAGFMDQIEKAKEAVVKSRKRIARLRTE
jgi:hypothetical protein